MNLNLGYLPGIPRLVLGSSMRHGIYPFSLYLGHLSLSASCKSLRWSLYSWPWTTMYLVSRLMPFHSLLLIVFEFFLRFILKAFFSKKYKQRSIFPATNGKLARRYVRQLRVDIYIIPLLSLTLIMKSGLRNNHTRYQVPTAMVLLPLQNFVISVSVRCAVTSNSVIATCGLASTCCTFSLLDLYSSKAFAYLQLTSSAVLFD